MDVRWDLAWLAASLISMTLQRLRWLVKIRMNFQHSTCPKDKGASCLEM